MFISSKEVHDGPNGMFSIIGDCQTIFQSDFSFHHCAIVLVWAVCQHTVVFLALPIMCAAVLHYTTAVTSGGCVVFEVLFWFYSFSVYLCHGAHVEIRGDNLGVGFLSTLLETEFFLAAAWDTVGCPEFCWLCLPCSCGRAEAELIDGHAPFTWVLGMQTQALRHGIYFTHREIFPVLNGLFAWGLFCAQEGRKTSGIKGVLLHAQCLVGLFLYGLKGWA